MDELEGKPVYTWTTSDVSTWIVSLGGAMKNYVQTFLDNDVDGSRLYELTEDDLRPDAINVTKNPHKKKIFNGIKKLRYSQAQQDSKDAKKAGKSGELMFEKSSNVGKKKQVESGMGVDLHVDGELYQFNTTCTFCQMEDKIALVHCMACKDFLCEDCDAQVHMHAKRKNHIRTVISSFDMDTAGQKIISFIRFIVCQKILKAKVRETFDRFYNPSERMHYYYNLKTNKVQWHKPYCLKSEELRPFMTYDIAAFKIQNLYRVRVAHREVVERLTDQYDKIYDRESGFFYYYYNGVLNPTPTDPNNRNRNFLMEEVTWKKPVNFYSKDAKLLFTEDLAALRIQFAFRNMKAKQFMRILVRTFFDYRYDPITGRHYYRNTVNGHSMWRKPRMLGREKWDPEDVRHFDVDEVVYFFRRLGFKKFGYVDAVRQYQIDGLLLLTFEWEDYVYLGVKQSMHIKQIMLALQRRPWYATHIDHPKDLQRRDRLRRHHNIDAAARLLQKKFRERYARALTRRFHEILRVQKQKEEIERER